MPASVFFLKQVSVGDGSRGQPAQDEEMDAVAMAFIQRKAEDLAEAEVETEADAEVETEADAEVETVAKDKTDAEDDDNDE
ncbi:hypothetical protein Q9L58_009374 [Maublancomyces gigas]|uniref:Uncharacterized protein n=1 Tax=Discina gigas TaxID=1032678 RepID=A0ABR3G860_9PEZI